MMEKSLFELLKSDPFGASLSLQSEPIPARSRNLQTLGTSTFLIETRHVSFSEIRVSGFNEEIYRKISCDDPAIQALAESIRARGLLDPLVLSDDLYIISGHRRFVALSMTRFRNGNVQCSIAKGLFHNDPDFLIYLREFNRQRVKGVEESVREQHVDASISTNNARAQLQIDKITRADIRVSKMEIFGTKKRSEISDAMQPFIDAIKKVISETKEFWPLSDRQVHYLLLNAPPLRHAFKAGSTYKNDHASYQRLTDLLTRARLTQIIQWHVIADPTRPMVNWAVYTSVAPFIERQMERFMVGYARNYMQSQPHHIEIIGEKNTIESIIRPVASDFRIPYTIGRGYASIQPRHDLFLRYEKSTKENLVLLFLTDHDPDGEEIAQSFSRSMRDDFGIKNIYPVRVALTRDQVIELQLPAGGKAKKGSSNYDKYAKLYGDDVYELEAVPPKKLQQMLRDAITHVVDIDALNREKEQEREEKAALLDYRTKFRSDNKKV